LLAKEELCYERELSLLKKGGPRGGGKKTLYPRVGKGVLISPKAPGRRKHEIQEKKEVAVRGVVSLPRDRPNFDRNEHRLSFVAESRKGGLAYLVEKKVRAAGKKNF